MAKQQKYWRIVSFVALFCVTASPRAQSLSELEKELLSEGSSSSSNVEIDDEPSRPSTNRNSKSSRSSNDYSSSSSAGDLLEDFAQEDQKAAGEDYAFDEDERKQLEDSAAEEIDEAISGPKQIPFDHILVVKHRYVNKEDRFELAPIMVGIQPADSFRKQLGVGFSLAYHFTEDFAFEFLHASFTTNYRSSIEEDLNKAIADTGGGAPLGFRRIEPVATLGSSIWWIPFKGKSATIENVYHWEAYFHGGGGMTRTDESFVGMGMFGAGARLYLNRRAVLRLELRDYYDFSQQGDHRVNIVAGASVLFGEN